MTEETITVRFVNEKRAEKFVEFLADTYGMDVEIESYLHVVIPTGDLSTGEIELLFSDVEDFCGDVVL